MLDRLGKAMMMAAEHETKNIIRRRLFEWHGFPEEARKTISEYISWIEDHKNHLNFHLDTARQEFEEAYPFHPAVLSLFERKWQTLPRFQQTRGILRLLASWVARAYSDGYKKRFKDPLIALGTAPLDDPNFQAAVFEQLGENRLEAAVTTDIAGRTDAHAVRLDNEAIDAVKKARLHRKCAASIFFESNGGQTREGLATLPEIKLSVGEPDIDIGLVDSVLQTLLDSCYYLTSINNKFKFSIHENLIKRFTDRRAGVSADKINEIVEMEVRKVFDKGKDFENTLFPEKNNQITDRPVVSLVVLHPSRQLKEKEKTAFIEDAIRNYGATARVYKSGLIFAVPDDNHGLNEEARKFLAWESIWDEASELNLEDDQVKQVKINMDRAKKDLTENIWKAYKNLILLNKDNQLHTKDLGLIHSSQARTLTELYRSRLESDGEIASEINPNFLVRHWPPAFTAWSTKSVRDAFYQTPQFPRLLNAESLKITISKGVENGFIAYVGKKGNKYDPFFFGQPLNAQDVEISDDMFIITADEAKIHIEPRKLSTLKIIPQELNLEPGKSYSFIVKGYDQHGDELVVDSVGWETNNGVITEKGLLTVGETEGLYQVIAKSGEIKASATVNVQKSTGEITAPKPPTTAPPGRTKIAWSGLIHPKKWNVFYTKILARFATNPSLKVTVNFEVDEDTTGAEHKKEETKSALRELGLDEELE
ncbi:MAG: DUF499 domain-containing protein [Syntrophaceae bacterium]|nr:DUF499 domain-containing protein [Syntrophaceae bacterium]